MRENKRAGGCNGARCGIGFRIPPCRRRGGAGTTQPAPASTPDVAEEQTIILAPADDTAIRPFSFHASDDELADLKWRLAAMKWPERETVTDATPHRSDRSRSERTIGYTADGSAGST